jgi:hypothetical protein
MKKVFFSLFLLVAGTAFSQSKPSVAKTSHDKNMAVAGKAKVETKALVAKPASASSNSQVDKKNTSIGVQPVEKVEPKKSTAPALKKAKTVPSTPK